MGAFTKSLLILLFAVSTPILYRQFANDNTVKFISSYYSNYKSIDQFLRQSANHLDRAKEYVPNTEQVKGLVNKLQQQISTFIAPTTKTEKGKYVKEKATEKGENNDEKRGGANIKLTQCPGLDLQIRLWSKEELKKYDGNSSESDIYLSFLGIIYNVTINEQHYAKGAEYNVFAGRDATRAFLTGNFTHDLHDDIRGVDEGLYAHIESWASFYGSNYPILGRLEGQYYDSRGCGTQELARVYQMSAKLEQEKADRYKEREKNLPDCNSEWNSETKQGRVWCSTKSGGVEREWAGLPRIYNDGESNRCACINSDGLNEELAKVMSVYPGCDPEASECNLVQ